MIIQFLDPLLTIKDLSLKYNMNVNDYSLAPISIYIVNYLNPVSRYFSTLSNYNSPIEDDEFFIKGLLYSSSWIEGYFDKDFNKFEMSIKYNPRENDGIPSIFHGNLVENNNKCYAFKPNINIKNIVESNIKKDFGLLILNSGLNSK